MSKLEWTRADPRPSRSAPAFSQIEWISAPNCNTLPFFGVRGWGMGGGRGGEGESIWSFA